MKLKAFSLFLILTTCKTEKITECNYIENYYQKIYLADFEYMTDNFEKAFELYQDAFSSCEPINTSGYNELGNFARTCAILGKNELAIKFIKKQIERGYELKWLLEDEAFDKVFTSKKGKKLISNYISLRKAALSKLNLELREEIQKMEIEDKKYRTSNYQENVEKQNAIDNYNTNRIIEIFNEFQYPNETLVGSYGVDQNPADIAIILLHTSDSIRINYFVPKLTQFVKNGTCSPHTLGVIIDQYYLYNGEQQINGTYSKQEGGYANMILDLKKVDSNRVSIGLPPLKLKEKKDSILRIKFGDRFSIN